MGTFFFSDVVVDSIFLITLWIDSDLVAFERSKLKEHMQYCMDHPDEISKLAKVKAQVSEVKGVMMENIEKVLV